MANLPESIWGDSPSVAGPNKSTAANAERLAALEQWIKALQSHETRERALIVLSKVKSLWDWTCLVTEKTTENNNFKKKKKMAEKRIPNMQYLLV